MVTVVLLLLLPIAFIALSPRFALSLFHQLGCVLAVCSLSYFNGLSPTLFDILISAEPKAETGSIVRSFCRLASGLSTCHLTDSDILTTSRRIFHVRHTSSSDLDFWSRIW